MKAVLTPIIRVFVRVQVEGREHVPKRGPVILASNHRSFLDSIFIPLVVRRRVTFVAKAEYFDDPKTAWFFRELRADPDPPRRRQRERTRARVGDRGAAQRARCSASTPRAPARATACCTAATPASRASRCAATCRSCPIGLIGTDEVQPDRLAPAEAVPHASRSASASRSTPRATPAASTIAWRCASSPTR